MELLFDLAIPLLVIYPKNCETPIQKNLHAPIFIAEPFPIAKCWKQPKYPSVNEWVKELVHLHNGILCSRKEEGISTLQKAWMELESIMLSEVSQVVKNKYHMISPISGT